MRCKFKEEDFVYAAIEGKTIFAVVKEIKDGCKYIVEGADGIKYLVGEGRLMDEEDFNRVMLKIRDKLR